MVRMMSRLVVLLGQNQPCSCVPPAGSDPRFCVPEPAAAEGQLLGGTGGGSQEAEACLPLYRRSALRQTKETDRRVRSFNTAPQFSPPPPTKPLSSLVLQEEPAVRL